MLDARLFAWVLAVAAVVLPETLAAGVVGLRDAHEQFFVGVRGTVPQGTVITGIRFYSNDATALPEVFLAGDTEDRRLPAPGGILRSVQAVSASPGYVIVRFAPYEVPGTQHLWAIVRFPANAVLRMAGPGGGPGIGWRATRLLDNERSLFSVDGALNEFSPAFDIELVTATPGEPLAKSASSGDDRKSTGAFDIRTRMQTGTSVTFVVRLPRECRVRLDLYSVAGHHVSRLVDGTLGPGVHEFEWPGTDSQQKHVARGIYLYKAFLGAEARAGKVVVLK